MIAHVARSALLSVVLSLAASPGVAWAGTLAARAEAADKVLLADLQSRSAPAAERVRNAQKATSEREHIRAYNLLKEAMALVPEHPALTRRTALAAFRIDRRDEGFALARKAVSLDPAPENQVALAQILLQTEDREDGKEASALIVKAADASPEDPLAQGVCCVVTAKWGPRDALHRCTNRYLATAPDEAEAHFYGAVAALDRDDLPVAQKEITKAKELGLPVPMLAAVEARLHTLRPPVKPVNQSVARTTQLVPLVYPGSLALLYLVRERLRARARGPLGDPRAKKPLGDRLDRAALRLLLIVFFLSHFLLVPIVVGLLAGSVLVVLVGPSTPAFAAGALVALALAGFLLRSISAEAELSPAGPLPPGLEAAAGDVADRVGTYPVELVRFTEGAFVDVIEETTLLGRTKGEAVRTLVIGDAAKRLAKGELRAALAHAHARIATKDVATGSAAGLLAWLERTSEAVPIAIMVRLARFLVGPVLAVAAERQTREADAVVTYLFGPNALARVLEGTGIPKSERSQRIAASKALSITPRGVDDDDDEPTAGWFDGPATDA